MTGVIISMQENSFLTSGSASPAELNSQNGSPIINFRTMRTEMVPMLSMQLFMFVKTLQRSCMELKILISNRLIMMTVRCTSMTIHPTMITVVDKTSNLILKLPQ